MRYLRFPLILGVLCLFITANQYAISNNSKPGLRNKSAAGNIQTQKISHKVGIVKKTAKTDPYTGSRDKKNFIGKVPMVKNQTAVQKKYVNKK